MKLKKYEGLSSYLIDEDGNVHSDAGIIPMISERRLAGTKYVTESFYKLKTDDLHGGFNIVRRFSREDIVKMYNSPKAARYDVTFVQGTEPSGTVISGIEEAGEITKDQFDQLSNKNFDPESKAIFADAMLNKMKAKTATEVKVKFKDVVKHLGELVKDVPVFKDNPVVKMPKGFKLADGKGLYKKPVKKAKKKTAKAKKVQPVSKYIKKGLEVEEAAIELMNGMKMTETVERVVDDIVTKIKMTGDIMLPPAKEVEHNAVFTFNHCDPKQSPLMKIPFFVINDVPYQSARKAAKELKISVNTVLKRCKLNQDGYFYIEK